MKGIGRGRAGSAVTRQKKTASDANAARHSHNAGPEAADPAAAAAALPAPNRSGGHHRGVRSTRSRALSARLSPV